MEIFNPHANFDFIGKKNVFIAFSIFLVIGSLISIFKPGLKFGIDFSGGTEVQIQFNKSIDSAEVRKILNDSGFKDSSVQHLGVAGSQEFLIRLEQTSGNLKSLQDDVAKTFTKSQGEGSFNIKKIEMVGPRVGADLKRRGAWALFYSLIGILIYVALRFDYRFAPGGVVALLHDAIIPLGVFAVLGKKFDLTILAAILTIIGYSINDTIVIFDRIRELMKTYPGMDIVAIINNIQYTPIVIFFICSNAYLHFSHHLVSIVLFHILRYTYICEFTRYYFFYFHIIDVLILIDMSPNLMILFLDILHIYLFKTLIRNTIY